jgi:hypothetical protein
MNKALLLALALGLSANLAWADKPAWAGQGGGKPSDQQIEEHRDAMRDKNDDKAGRKEPEYEQKQEKEQEKVKAEKKAKKEKGDGGDDD